VLRCLQVACGIGIFLGTALSQNVPPQGWASLDRQAEELYTKGDLKEAIRIARLAVDAASGPKQSGRSMDRLGFFEYTSCGRRSNFAKLSWESIPPTTRKARMISPCFAGTPPSYLKRESWPKKRSGYIPACSARAICASPKA
jgi:hypothetical protein